jgi:putative PIN family toxin of toxin-antitoxin system
MRRSTRNSPHTTPKIVIDASSLVGALLRVDSIPEQALLLARSHAVICLSGPVAAELREVFNRPRFIKYASPDRVTRILDVIGAGAMFFEPTEIIADCRDRKDNKYLELALASQASIIISSDNDVLSLNPWRGIEIITPAEYVRSTRTKCETRQVPQKTIK